MNVNNKLFYVSTVIPSPADVSSVAELDKLIPAMQYACYGPTFQAGECARLSRAVGRALAQQKCQQNAAQAATAAASVLASGQPVPFVVPTLSAGTVASALAAYGQGQ